MGVRFAQKELEISLADNSDNGETLYDYNGKKAATVTLSGRTLYKDGTWNTLCLPFALTAEQVSAQLAPDELMTLERSDLYQGTLTLNFVNATNIEAGKPYIIKWNTQSTDYVENPEFTDVTISNSHNPVETEFANFVGVFSPTDIYTEEKTYLYLGADNNLYYPWGDGMTSFKVNSCRAYFKLNNDLVAGAPIDPASGINNFVLNFGGESSIVNVPSSIFNLQSEGWYTLDGRKLSGVPTLKGIYINNGKKMVIK